MTGTNRTIAIDEEVFAFLQAHGEPLVDTPNDVLRRLLLQSAPGGANPAPAAPAPGALLPFLQRGWLRDGEELHHTKKRSGVTFRAHVTPEGGIRIDDGRVFLLPSPALKAQVGSEINGWGQYLISRTEEPLQTLRDRLKKEQQGS
ncbi:hypothetical protein ABZ747_08415 [Kitasatospora cineracea]|uniref:restriction system modified-DNA reader domain-containing protein n=1 Tax=Kitasatospora cineracea TaxID=88074 RepID=UPI0033E8B7BB